MKALKNIAIGMVALLAVAGPAAAQVKDYRDIKTPPMRSFNPTQPKRIQLANGMVIFLQEDHELPLIKGSAIIRGGSRDIPANKAGLTEILGQSWRTGGTESKTGDQLDELLESRAARVETNADDDSSSVSFDVLKNDLDFAFPIFLDVLQHPAFRAEKIDLAKNQLNTGISRRNDEPGGILGREAAKLGYGANSSYVRQPEYASVASVTREDLLAFHKRFVHPNNIILGVVGDFDSVAMEKRLRSTFGKWQKGPQAPAAPTDITAPKPGVYFIAKDDVTQSNITFVHSGYTRNSPDYPAVQVMNEVLGGGFSGRLMNSLRSKMGLTYGIGGGVGSTWDHPGLFRVTTSTKSGTTLQSIEAIRNEINLLRTAPVTAEELDLAKNSILNAFVFTMDSKEKSLNQRMLLEFYGYPTDFYSRYPALVEKVTAEDVARVAQKYVHPDQVAVVVVGNEKDFEKPLSSLGTVTPIDITIPEPGSEKKPAAAPSASAAPASTSAAAMALAAKVRDYVGGKSKLDAVQSMRTIGSMTMKTPQGDMSADVDRLNKFPDSQRMVMKLPMGEFTTVLTPGGAFAITPMGTQDLPGSQRESMAGELKTDLVTVLKNLENPKYVFSIEGSEKVGDVQTQVLAVNADGQSIKWFVDPATGRIVRESSQGRGPMPGERITEYGVWKAFGGITLPTATTLMRGGEKAGEFTVSNVEINPAVDAKMFEKPAAK
jgi:zinc protease